MTGVVNSITQFSSCGWSAGGFQIPEELTFSIVKEIIKECPSSTPFLVCKAWAQFADNELLYAELDPSKVFPKLNLRILDIPKWRECIEKPEKLGLDLDHAVAFTKADFIMLKLCQCSGVEAENEAGYTIIDIPTGHSWEVLEQMASMGAVPLTLTSKVVFVDEFITQRVDAMRRYVVPNNIVQLKMLNGSKIKTTSLFHASQKVLICAREPWEMVDGLTAGTLVVLTQKVFNIYVMDRDRIMTQMNTTSKFKDGSSLVLEVSSLEKKLTVGTVPSAKASGSLGAGAMMQLPGTGHFDQEASNCCRLVWF